MGRERRILALGLVAVAALAAGACTRVENTLASVPFLNFMRNAPSLDPYEAPRPAPPNAVPVQGPGADWEPPVEATEAALRAWGDTMTNPLAAAPEALAEGARVFATYCSVCHGVHGEGDGPIIAPDKFPMATNLMLPATVERTDGYIYAVIRTGRGLMPPYQRIPPVERWAVVHYLRHLQRGGEPIRVELPGRVQPGGAAAAGGTGGEGSEDAATGGAAAPSQAQE